MKRAHVPKAAEPEIAAVREQDQDPGNKPRLLLEALQAPMTPAALFERAGIPRSTAYRHLEKLINQGFVTTEGELVRMSEAGTQRLRQPSSQDDARALERLWPWLRHLPTALHRAFLTLALFTLSARRSNCVDDRHPGLILLGSTQRLKSWLCKVLCFLGGSTPERCRVPMQQVRQRGLLIRLDAKGEIAYRSEQLTEPFLWLEEFSLAEPGVLRDVTALMQGPKTVRIENQQVNVDSVPLFEMNPVKQSDDLAERLNLRPERIRRNFVADFSKSNVTRAMRASAGETAESLKAIGPLSFPPASNLSLSKESLGLIDEALNMLVHAEKIDFVDPSRLQTAVLGARAWLTETDAVAEALWSWGELAESTGYLIAGWRARLAGLLHPPERMEPPTCPKNPHEELQCTAQQVETAMIHYGERTMNRYVLDEVLVEQKELLNAAGLRIPEDTSRIKTLLSVVARLVKDGVKPHRLFSDPGQWVRLQALQQFLDANRLKTSDIKCLLDHFNGWGPAVAQQRGILMVWSPLPVKSLPPGEHGAQLFEQLEAWMINGPPSVEDAQESMRLLRACYENCHAAYAELREENEWLHAEINRLKQPPLPPAPQKSTSTSEPNNRA